MTVVTVGRPAKLCRFRHAITPNASSLEQALLERRTEMHRFMPRWRQLRQNLFSTSDVSVARAIPVWLSRSNQRVLASSFSQRDRLQQFGPTISELDGGVSPLIS